MIETDLNQERNLTVKNLTLLIFAVYMGISSSVAQAALEKNYFTCAADTNGPELTPFTIGSVTYTPEEANQLDPLDTDYVKAGFEYFVVMYMPKSNMTGQPEGSRVKRQTGSLKTGLVLIDDNDEAGSAMIAIKGKAVLVDMNFKGLPPLDGIENTGGPTWRYTCKAANQKSHLRSL